MVILSMLRWKWNQKFSCINYLQFLFRQLKSFDFHMLFFRQLLYIKNGVWICMEQKIYCSVGSCTYNAKGKNECKLKSIQVTPCNHCKNGSPEDESFCGSYSQGK